MRSLIQYDSNANDDLLKLINEFVLLPHIKAHEVIHVNYPNVTMSICTYIFKNNIFHEMCAIYLLIRNNKLKTFHCKLLCQIIPYK